MVSNPVTDIDPIVQVSVTGHAPKGAWIAEMLSPGGGFYVYKK